MNTQEKLPNSTIILVFGILSIITCCCWGIVGLIFGVVALILARKDMELYKTHPELYTGYKNVKTGRTLAIIGIILSAIYLIFNIIMIMTYGWEGILEMQEEWMREYGG